MDKVTAARKKWQPVINILNYDFGVISDEAKAALYFEELQTKYTESTSTAGGNGIGPVSTQTKISYENDLKRSFMPIMAKIYAQVGYTDDEHIYELFIKRLESTDLNSLTDTHEFEIKFRNDMGKMVLNKKLKKIWQK